MAAGGSQIRGRRDGSAEAQHSVFARCKQVLWQELVPFGILAGGWVREMALASTFVPCQAELCSPGLNNFPSRCPPSLPFSEQSCQLITFQMSSPLAVGTHSFRPLCFLQPDSGAPLGRRAAPLPRLPPASPWSAHRLAALPTLFRGPLICTWLRKLRSASLLAFSGLFRQMWWNLSDQQDAVSPESSYATIFPGSSRD